MILYEYEGKSLLQAADLAVPKSQLISSPAEKITSHFPLILKAQVLSGKRAAAGGIVRVDQSVALSDALEKIFQQKILGEPVSRVLVEEVIEATETWYLAIAYDANVRGPVLLWSREGGTGIEERAVKSVPLDITTAVTPSDFPLPASLVQSLIDLFLAEDLLLLEINPLVFSQGQDGIKRWYALDAKVKLDDNAVARHKNWQYPPRAVAGRQATEREVAAKKIDQGDHRGTAGSAYLDLDGDIAVLASGGGASLTALDALIKVGGQPANYTEYSGNPSREKVQQLTQVVLSKPGLNGLWIVGAVANFTDIYETLTGIIEGLRQVEKAMNRKFDFPIVIRRGGPRDEEAFAMIESITDFDIHLCRPEISIAGSAKLVVELAAAYARKSSKQL